MRRTRPGLRPHLSPTRQPSVLRSTQAAIRTPDIRCDSASGPLSARPLRIRPTRRIALWRLAPLPSGVIARWCARQVELIVVIEADDGMRSALDCRNNARRNATASHFAPSATSPPVRLHARRLHSCIRTTSLSGTRTASPTDRQDPTATYTCPGRKAHGISELIWPLLAGNTVHARHSKVESDERKNVLP